MKKNYLKLKLSFVMILFFSFNVLGQKDNSFWIPISKEKASQEVLLPRTSEPTVAIFFKLDIESLKSSLQNIPVRGTSIVSDVLIAFPNAKGVLETFRIKEASNMDPELQAQFPNIKSYIGQSINNSSSILRFSLSPQKGLSSMVLSGEKTVFIEPYSQDLSTYIVFINSYNDINTSSFRCETESFQNDIASRGIANANDGQLRTFRLALACTGEYASFHGGTVGGVMAAMNTTMTRVNGVFERDLALTMTMVSNVSIIFLNAATDPYTNNNGGAMLTQNQTTCDNLIGSANYDIGHVFSTGGGGVAFLASACSGSKAGGVTGAFSPVGDTFDIDFVAHEFGHQYGATHTQNNNCQRDTNVSVEPGSASTIMGYAGICAPNVQNNSDDYFHRVSILQMWNRISPGGTIQCAAQSNTNNAAPIADAGADYAIPRSTAFVLRGSATDANAGNSLTYCWEQMDATPAQMPPVSTSTVGPAFRSLQPTTSADRFMPTFSTVLGGSLQTTWEVVPSVARTMNFSLTVRDNVLGGAGTDSDPTVVTVENVVPFTVSTPPTWAQGTTQTVNWVVGETNNVTINCQNVNILFSNDGGASFSTLLANTPNDGSQSITVPAIADTTTARIMVEAADNIFYAVTPNFAINNTADFAINNTNGGQSACNIDSVTYNFDYTTSNGFSENTAFTATGNPGGSNVVFTPGNLNSSGSFTMEVNNLLGVAVNNYTITVTATSPSITKNIDVSLTVANGVCASVANTTYATSTTGVVFNTISNLNTGKPSGYSDYTAMSTDVNRESSYNLTVNVNTDGNFLCTTIVWIDWNQNCSFNDPGEEYDLGDTLNVTNGPTANSPLSITIPVGAALGNTIMRVSTKYNPDGLPTSCENGADAEVEDYTVNVMASLSVNENEFNNFAIYPNPNKGTFNVKMNALSDNNINITVYDIRGRKVYDNRFVSSSNFNEEITLSNVQSGLYLVKVSDGLREVIKKIVIE